LKDIGLRRSETFSPFLHRQDSRSVSTLAPNRIIVLNNFHLRAGLPGATLIVSLSLITSATQHCQKESGASEKKRELRRTFSIDFLHGKERIFQ
jgi:hypothetical protein